MRRRGGRLGRAAMWTGLAACVLLLIVDVASVWWYVGWTSRQRHSLVAVARGRIGAAWTRGGTPLQAFGPGWHVVRFSTPSIGWWPTIQTNLPPRSVFAIPLWIPLVAVAIPTGLLWRRNRPAKPGHCPSCRYNLTGNVSGVCPECGEKV